MSAPTEDRLPAPQGTGDARDAGRSPWPMPYPPTHQVEQLPAAGRPAGPSRTALGLFAVVLVVACGAVGALAGSIEAHRRPAAAAASLTIPAATLPVTGPTVAPASRAGSVAAIAAAVLPSVVTIRVGNATEQGTGSGVIIRSDGYILTNNHVVAPGVGEGGTLVVDLSATVMNVPAEVVGRSPSDDLAVIKVPETGLRAARLGNSSSLAVGDEVVAVGAPLGLSGSVTAGIVSALNRNVDVPAEGGGAAGPAGVTVLGDAIQTDAAINPGNSGGALVDDTGAVVGINSAIASLSGTGTQNSTQSGSIGVGFSIPIDYAASVATQIIRTGTVTHPYLGISVTSVTAADASQGGPSSGALVRAVVAGGPAATADLRVGDVITALDGRRINTADDLIVDTRAYAIGRTVALRLIRGGTTMTVSVLLAEKPGS